MNGYHSLKMSLNTLFNLVALLAIIPFQSIEIDLLFLESGRASFIPRRFDNGFVGLGIGRSTLFRKVRENGLGDMAGLDGG